MKNRTTIQIPKEVREALKKARLYRRETYADQIKRMIKEQVKREKNGRY